MKLSLAILFLPSAILATEPLTHDRMPTNILSPSRPWEGFVGVPGGIHNRTTINVTRTSAASAATLNSDIAACTSNQVVLCQAGNYSLNDAIRFNNNGVTLRGETDANGTPTTVFNFTTTETELVRFGTGDYFDTSGWFVGAPSGGYTDRTVSTGIARGSTRITVSAAPTGLGNQQWMMLSAPSDAGVIGGGGFSNFDSSGTSHPATFIVQTTNVSGTTIDFWPPLQSDYWNGTVHIHYRAYGDSPQLSGIENIKITRSAGIDGASIRFVGAMFCWASNVVMEGSGDTGTGHFGIDHYVDFRSEVRRCSILDADDLNSETYAIRTVQSSGALWEDNIISGWPNVHALFGCNLSVFAANFVTNVTYFSGFLSQILMVHASHNSYNLVEHSYFPRCVHDTGSEPGDGEVMVYNGDWVPGWDGSDGGKEQDAIYVAWQKEPSCSYTETYSIRRFSVLNSFLGRSGSHNILIDVDDCSAGANTGIYRIELVSSNTFLARNNYNNFSTAIPAAEAYTGGETATTSYFKPSNTLGSPRFPPFDPANPSTIFYTNIQAGHRFAWVTNFVGGGGGGNPFKRGKTKNSGHPIAP